MNHSRACALIAANVEIRAFLRSKGSNISCFWNIGQGLTLRRLSSISQSAQRPRISGEQPMAISSSFLGLHLQSLRQLHDDVASSSKTVSSVLKDMTERFEEADIPESNIAAEYIMTHALGKSRLSELCEVDQSRLLSQEEMDRLASLVEQKFQRVPVQYILGEWDFRDLTLKMRPPVFIPRPETEMLIDLVTSHYEEEDAWRFLEVGCGTGAISLSLLAEFEKAHITAIDGSSDAVALTCENAERLGLSERLEVHHLPLTEEVPEVLGASCSSGYYDAVISNPPYIFTGDMDDLDPEIERYEDPRALDAGPDGLAVIRCIIKHASHLLRPGGLIWLETDSRHHRMLQDWLRQHPETGVHFRKSFLDFNDRPRFCQLEYAPSENTDSR